MKAASTSTFGTSFGGISFVFTSTSGRRAAFESPSTLPIALSATLLYCCSTQLMTPMKKFWIPTPMVMNAFRIPMPTFSTVATIQSQTMPARFFTPMKKPPTRCIWMETKFAALRTASLISSQYAITRTITPITPNMTAITAIQGLSRIAALTLSQ